MTLKQLERRVSELERTVEVLHFKPMRAASEWLAQAGHFKGDPLYADIVKRGRAYRKSLRTPGRKKSA